MSSNLPVGAYERGPQPLGDEFFLLTLDDSARFRLSPRVRGLGLAAALLAELMTTGADWAAPQVRLRCLTIVNGRVRLVQLDRPDRRVGQVGYDIYRDLMSEAADQPVSTWLLYLAVTAEDRIADRLVRARRLHFTRRRFRRTVSYQPADITAAYPWARLSTGLRQGHRVDWPDVVLLGLAWATGLQDALLAGSGPWSRQYLDRLLAYLPPPLRALLDHTRAAAGDAVLSTRT